MSLKNIDHVALEVPDLDEYIATFESTDGLRLIRKGYATATGQNIAMLGDPNGVKIELIENPSCDRIRFLHLAFASDEIERSIERAVQQGWTLIRGPSYIPPAKASSAFLREGSIEFQVLEYEFDSPDLVRWEP